MTPLSANPILALALAGALGAPAAALQGPPPESLERVTTAVPFPRGLAVVDGELYALARGRVRDSGGVVAEVDDRAGTIFRIDLSVSEPWSPGDPSAAIQGNGVVYAEPTEPPFRLWRRDSEPPQADRLTDRPYAALRYDAATDSFYICAFSGVDLGARTPSGRAFSKNLTDAILRFDRQSRTWSEIERHDHYAGGNYPHHDPAHFPPPHGWLNGPNNLVVVADGLFAAAKDNSLLVRYDLSQLAAGDDGAAPDSEWTLGTDLQLEDGTTIQLLGHSALAERGGWLYLATRTSGHIVRLPLDDSGRPAQPGQLLALFDPFDPATGRSANITDIGFDDAGRLFVVSASPAAVHAFVPDPARVHDARGGASPPWFDLAGATDNPLMKSENLLAHDGWLYITSGDGYGYQAGAEGTIYRLPLHGAQSPR